MYYARAQNMNNPSKPPIVLPGTTTQTFADARIIKPNEASKEPKLGDLTAPLWEQHAMAFNASDFATARIIQDKIQKIIGRPSQK